MLPVVQPVLPGVPFAAFDVWKTSNDVRAKSLESAAAKVGRCVAHEKRRVRATEATWGGPPSNTHKQVNPK